ncbi:MAG: ATP-dependent serine protease [Tannerella sp.]|jgi:hypothetical protein|nr:ATP-dependent serine protease [Tannerella sp.]
MGIKGELTLRNIIESKIPVFDFRGEWLEAFGKPQRSGIWYIYGDSGHGKTSFILKLIKELAKFDKILFVSYEEGSASTPLQEGISRFGLLEANRKVSVCTKKGKELTERLDSRKCPNIVIVDSLDVSDFKRSEQVVELKNRYKNKLFIFTGWAKGREPAKRIGEDVLFMANQKIFIEGYRAISRGRSFGERGYLTVWEKGATDYWEFK